MFAIKKFKNTTSFFNIGIPSSEIGFFQCSNLTDEIFFVSLQEVKSKCFRMPLQLVNTETNSNIAIFPNNINHNDDILLQSKQYVVCTMQHFF